MQACKQRTLRRRSVVTAREVIRPLVHTTDEWWLACKETSPNIPSPHLDLAWTYTWTWPGPTWRATFLLQLHLLHLDLLLLSLPRPVIKLVQLQVSWPSEREQEASDLWERESEPSSLATLAITTQSSPADRVLRVHKAEQSWETYLENNIPSPTWRTTLLHLPGPGLDRT